MFSDAQNIFIIESFFRNGNKIKKDLHLYPYRVTAIHKLLPNDVPQRLNFCEWFLNNFQEENGGAFEKIFFTDEAYYYLSGYIYFIKRQQKCLIGWLFMKNGFDDKKIEK